MANTIALTTAGKQAYENFAGQIDGTDATSVDFTLKAPVGEKWVIKTVSGENFMRPSNTGFNTLNSGFSKIYDAGAVCLSQFSYQGAASNLSNLMRFAGAVGGTIIHCLQGHRIIWTGGYANTGIMVVDTSFTATYSAAAIYTVQSFFKSGRFAFTVWRDSDKVFSVEAPKSLTVYPTGSDEKWFGMQMLNTSHFMGRALLQTGGIITFSGLTSGVKINLLNASTDAVENTLYASGATTSIELSGVEMFPLNKKIQVIGTDGSVLLTTAAQQIFGGDTWTYSGDTATPNVIPKKIITKLNVAGGY